MELEVAYGNVRFPARVVREAFDLWVQIHGVSPNIRTLMVSNAGETWRFDDLEEFFDEYDKGFASARIYVTGEKYAAEEGQLDVKHLESVDFQFTHPHLGGPLFSSSARNRNEILQVMRIFRDVREQYVVDVADVAVERPVIFIGHGHGRDWADLYRHLRDQQGLNIFAYESEERAGQTIQDFLSEALERANFALMVMTADDATSSGEVRARQNVVHETGLFQGKLGWRRVILIAENGIESYSNLAGTQELRFDTGNVESVAGRVLAVLRRQFPGGL